MNIDKQQIEQVATSLTPWARNARTHSRKRIRQIADSIRTFGFTHPVLFMQPAPFSPVTVERKRRRLPAWSGCPASAGGHDAGSQARVWAC